MIAEVVAGLITSAISGGAALTWRYRGRIGLTRSRTVRVSFCALLRIRAGDCYVLFHATSRPGSYGPPGGVYKYDDQGEIQLGFQDEPKPKALSSDMRRDLRGFIASGATRAFVRWFDSGRGRESATECLRRELTEELAEVNAPELIPDVATLTFALVRTIRQPLHSEPGSNLLHLRRLEIYDLKVADDETAARFKRQLLERAEDPAVEHIVGVDARDIRHGRCNAGLIGGHSAFLIGTKSAHTPFPAVR